MKTINKKCAREFRKFANFLELEYGILQLRF